MECSHEFNECTDAITECSHELNDCTEDVTRDTDVTECIDATFTERIDATFTEFIDATFTEFTEFTEFTKFTELTEIPVYRSRVVCLGAFSASFLHWLHQHFEYRAVLMFWFLFSELVHENQQVTTY